MVQTPVKLLTLSEFLELPETKVIRNILYCLDHGTEMGWLVDPDEELVFIYFSDRTIAVFKNKGDRLPVPVFAELFQLTVGQLFSWLKG